MLAFSAHELQQLIGSVLWPMVRLLAVIGAAPVLGHGAVPPRVKIGLALTIALVVAPALPRESLPPLDSPAALGVLAQQILIGVAIGFVMRAALAAAELAGEVVGLQMGLSYAGFFDAGRSGEGTVVGSWLVVVASLVFLAIDGHLLVVAAAVDSFRTLPVGADLAGLLDAAKVALIGAEIFRIGLAIALPLLATLLLTHLALGVLARVAPQLDVFAVGFPVTLMVGMLALALATPWLGQPIVQGFERMLELAPGAASR